MNLNTIQSIMSGLEVWLQSPAHCRPAIVVEDESCNFKVLEIIRIVFIITMICCVRNKPNGNDLGDL